MAVASQAGLKPEAPRALTSHLLLGQTSAILRRQCQPRRVSLTVGTMEAYRRAFIQTGSLAPLKHVMVLSLIHI